MLILVLIDPAFELFRPDKFLLVGDGRWIPIIVGSVPQEDDYRSLVNEDWRIFGSIVVGVLLQQQNDEASSYKYHFGDVEDSAFGKAQ